MSNIVIVMSFRIADAFKKAKEGNFLFKCAYETSSE